MSELRERAAKQAGRGVVGVDLTSMCGVGF